MAQLEQETKAITPEQGEQILSELKGIKQSIFLLVLISAFFAARAFLFHH